MCSRPEAQIFLMDTYILQKPLPGVTAGVKFIKGADGYYNPIPSNCEMRLGANYVEHMPEWFLPERVNYENDSSKKWTDNDMRNAFAAGRLAEEMNKPDFDFSHFFGYRYASVHDYLVKIGKIK